VDAGFGVVNNACWSAGEIALQYGKNMAQWVSELVQRLVELISNPRVPKGLTENAAIALGRLGQHNAEELAPHLGAFAEEFLTSMVDVDSSEEKGTAFRGFSQIVIQNPEAMEKVLLDFFVSIARYEDLGLQNPMKRELHEAFQNAINVYKQIIPQFSEFLGQMQPQDQQSLKEKFSI
jgi:transportin-1